jgi:pantetheine-phosphate adenylyltransferase
VRGIAIYPGSFDPITKGHTAILQSGLVAFEKLVVAVLNNDNKKALFSVAERMEMIREAAIDMGAEPSRIEVDSFDGLLVSYAKSRNARVILRGLRAVADFEYELQMANMNRHLSPEIETVFIMANDAYFYVASNLVKEVARLGGNVSDLVPAPVLPRLLAKFDR